MNNHSDYLQAKHARWSAPKDALRELVERTTGERAIALERVVEGYNNEVYVVRTDAPGSFIIRITRDGESSALEEAWCLRTCADAGVPVPDVVAVESIPTDEGALNAMVLSKLPGTPLLELLGSLSLADQAHAWRKMGVVLRKIHSVPAGGFYKRGPEGKWDFPDGAAIAQAGLKARMAEKPFLLAAGFDETDVAFMFGMMRYCNREFNCPDPVLCHGDFLPEHVFFDESMNVTGIIDFGWYEGAHPIRDFLHAWIDYGEREVALLREGYGRSRALDDRFELRLHLALVSFLIGIVAYKVRTKGASFTDDVRVLGSTVAWLRKQGV